jgi:hypothetical protein
MDIRNKIQQLNRFKELYYSLRYKTRFIQWMWKSREARIMEQYHPKYLLQFIADNHIADDDSEALDTFIKNWK